MSRVSAMQLWKPLWVKHAGSIEALDIAPDGKRLATCGIGVLSAASVDVNVESLSLSRSKSQTVEHGADYGCEGRAERCTEVAC